MCKPTDAAADEPPVTQNICVVGAGPAGLLATIFLLQRNDPSSSTPRYRVTLVDPGTDYGRLDSDGLNRARSWMIGLSCHGLSAIKKVPGLYEEYVRGLGIDMQHFRLGLTNSHIFELNAKDLIPENSAFTVDRNYICAALSRYLNDKYDEEAAFVTHYHTKALYVDGENKRVIARTKAQDKSDDFSIDYDVILGCDGIRSIVRNAFISTHRDFEFNLRGTFGHGKSVHVSLPPDVKDGTFMILNDAIPGFGSFVLPETGQKLNVAFGTPLNRECPPELLSDDPSVISSYFAKHFKAFKIDTDEVGRQWVTQGWNTTGQVHCNFYHSSELSAILLGDAAHATSPQIGQGMNTALADAAVLDELLDGHKDNWNAVLPKFSELRVKEGNALTDLSFHTFSLSASQQISLMLRQNLRRKLNEYLPFLVGPDPMAEIVKGMKLSEAYNLMKKYGVIERVRNVNDGIMRDHFERTSGMVTEEKGLSFKNLLYYSALPIAFAAYIAKKNL
uniref:FAD-binding domain-containing protein n=1 Tax=Trieres chinensis TaxID=1514140 RepID=A0A7S1ZIW9_TRICV|mmetsp:Transcript_26801/g.54859  ORF Transcript_26801/g.54859 Transcript_26801/m.54859 type:complete len:504 (+) Transcript_26801:160-1671(+)